MTPNNWTSFMSVPLVKPYKVPKGLSFHNMLHETSSKTVENTNFKSVHLLTKYIFLTQIGLKIQENQLFGIDFT